MFLFFFFKQKTAYEMRISDWSSDVCSSDLHPGVLPGRHGTAVVGARPAARGGCAGAAARLTAACEATGGAWPLPLIARPGRGIDDLPACRMICAATEQMGMRNDEIGEMSRLLDQPQGLGRSLKAAKEIHDRAHDQKLRREVATEGVPASVHGAEEIYHDRPHRDDQQH